MLWGLGPTSAVPWTRHVRGGAAMALALGLPKIKDEPTYVLDHEDVSKTAKRRRADTLPPSALVRRRKSSGKQSSPFVGVSWFKRERKWKAHITDTNGKQTQLGYFADELAAARAFDSAARRLRGQQAHGGGGGSTGWRLNFPTMAEAAALDQARSEHALRVAAAEATVAKRKAAGQHSSPFAGVSWDSREKRWRAEMYCLGNRTLGYFDTETAAARSYDAMARRLRGVNGRDAKHRLSNGSNAWVDEEVQSYDHLSLAERRGEHEEKRRRR